ncbi:DMT family transporter, partial [Pseudomonas sp. PAMC 25886]
ADLAVLLLGVFPSAMAYLAWAYVLRHVEVSRASVALYLVPPVAMVMAATLLGEQVSLRVVLGGLIVLASVGAISLEGRWRRKPLRVHGEHPQTVTVGILGDKGVAEVRLDR